MSAGQPHYLSVSQKAGLHTNQEKVGTKGYMNRLCAQHKGGPYMRFLIKNSKNMQQMKVSSLDLQGQ